MCKIGLQRLVYRQRRIAVSPGRPVILCRQKTYQRHVNFKSSGESEWSQYVLAIYLEVSLAGPFSSGLRQISCQRAIRSYLMSLLEIDSKSSLSGWPMHKMESSGVEVGARAYSRMLSYLPASTQLQGSAEPPDSPRGSHCRHWTWVARPSHLTFPLS